MGLRQRLRRPERPARRGETGSTLLEMVVVMALIGVVLPIAYQQVFDAQNQSTRLSNQNAGAQQGQSIVDTLSRQIGAAAHPLGSTSAIVTAGPSELAFYSLQGGLSGQPLYPFYYDVTWVATGPGNLGKVQEAVTKPSSTGSYTGQPTSTVVLGYGVAQPVTTPATGTSCSAGLFQYLQSDGTTCLALSNTATSPNTLTSAEKDPQTPVGGGAQTPALLETVVISFSVEAPNVKVGALSPKSTYQLAVTLRNVDDDY